ncbi:uncharacterized protein LOC131891299 [Tigriopus californicus]|uniref:uncharacterized protein LOC131891299 n=1 Tax=Tigriopus californicus TaxID=6832 RepID=UPI0027DAA50F|nr:uncharacterized protein LOC131891299 [Tigriopus californicus]
MVRSVKESLRSCLKSAFVTQVELYTLLCGIEGQINSRPISIVSADHEDPAPITPAHLVLGKSLVQLPDYPKRDMLPVKADVRWKYNQELQKKFWARWRKEYLVALQTSNAWKKKDKDPKLGEVVLIADKTVPRSTWPLAKIIELVISRDGLIRSCMLKTSTGIVKRSINVLHRLEDDL